VQDGDGTFTAPNLNVVSSSVTLSARDSFGIILTFQVDTINDFTDLIEHITFDIRASLFNRTLSADLTLSQGKVL
jgi:hypothetical protein